jgi:hypothetical protein
VRETTFDLSRKLVKEVTFGGFDAILKQEKYNQFVEYKDGQELWNITANLFQKILCTSIISTYKFNKNRNQNTD